MRQTRCIDNIECPCCGHKFDGQTAINGDMDCLSVDVHCPKCKKPLDISISVEYMATERGEDD
mgnify:CR=1 FL=1